MWGIPDSGYRRLLRPKENAPKGALKNITRTYSNPKQTVLPILMIVRRGIKSVQLEVYLVSLGHNLYKFHNKQMKIKSAA